MTIIHTHARRLFGISTVSLFPHSLGLNGLRNAWDIAFYAGFDGLQVLPMKGWDFNKNAFAHANVISYEDAWRPVQPFPQSALSGDILNWLAFGQNYATTLAKIKRYYPRAMPVGHHPDMQHVLEMKAEANLPVSGYLNYSQGLVFDTLHIFECPDLDWPTFLSQVRKERIKLIHLHPRLNQIDSFLRGEQSELTAMLDQLNNVTRFSKCPVILEFFPPMHMLRGDLMKFLKAMLAMSKKYLN